MTRIAVAGLLVVLFIAVGPACSSGNKPRKPDPVLLAEANRLASQGSYWYSRGCYQRAQRYFFQAAETSRLVDDLPGLVRAHNNLGAAALAQGRLAEAGEMLTRALELNKIVKDAAEEALILGNLAGMAFKAGRREEAEDLWRRAASSAQDLENQPGLPLHLTNLAMLLRTKGRLAEAEALLRQAQAAAVKNGPAGALAGIHLQLGLVAQASGDLNQAERQVSLALDLDKEAENPRGIAQDLEILGRLSQERSRWDQAVQELDRAIRLYAALGDQDKVREALGLLRENKTRSGRPESLTPYENLALRGEKETESLLCR
ncbi:MAG: tetratricopeptide repeat protein [Thermodesulfobacteriota bacterium]